MPETLPPFTKEHFVLKKLSYAVVTADLELIRRLIQEDGIDVNTQFGVHGACGTMLHIGTDYEVIKLLLENNADVNAKFVQGELNKVTLLDLVLNQTQFHDHKRLVKLLINDYGAELTRPIADVCALHAAIRFHYDLKAIRLMMAWETTGITRRCKFGKTALHVAFQHKASLDIVHCLIDHGIDINARTEDGESALQYALAFYVVNLLEVVHILIALEVDINASDDLGRTALHYALQYGAPSLEVVQCLIDHEIDINAKDNEGNTVLYYAIQYEASLELVQCLIAQNVDINADNTKSGKTALLLALTKGANREAVQLLIQDNNADNNTADKDGDTALHYALHLGADPEIVQLLIQHEADINAVNKFGSTPLHKGATKGVTVPVVELLLSHATYVCSRDQNRQTPLHGLVESDSIDTVTMFLEHIRSKYGADMMESVLVTANLNEEYLPFHHVRSLEMAKLLLEQRTFEDKEVVLRACHYMLVARDGSGQRLLDRQHHNVALREYLVSFTELPLAIPPSACDEQNSSSYEMAVRINPMLNDFQCTITKALLGKWKGWSKLFHGKSNIASEGAAMDPPPEDQEENMYVLPDEIKYGIMGYLTPVDIMKAVHGSNTPPPDAVRKEEPTQPPAVQGTQESPAVVRKEESINMSPPAVHAEEPQPDCSRAVSRGVTRALCFCWRR